MTVPTRHAEALHDGGLAAFRQGDLGRALEAIGTAIDAAPERALFRTSFGAVLEGLGERDAAHAAWRTALSLDPAEPFAWINLANAAQGAERARARTLYRRALAIAPSEASGLGNLALLEEKEEKGASARRLLAQALALEPASQHLWANLGSSCHWAAALEAAGSAFDRALALAPGHAATRFDRAVNRLLRGDWEKGLADYEARLEKPEAFRPALDLPFWQGEDPEGKHLLLWGEQGQGDTIQFLRFVSPLLERGAGVSLLVSPRLVSLVKEFPGIDRVHAIGAPMSEADAAGLDRMAPLMSVPFLLGLGAKTPAPVAPYLFASPAMPSSRLAPAPGDGRPRVGLAWAGNPKNESDRRRSLDLERLRPLLAQGHLRFVSLQFGPGAGEVAACGLEASIETPVLGDFKATAAVVAALDLVVTVDSALAHLAGSMGKETWVLLAHVPDWRWGMGHAGETAPWYPAMRLFRQPLPGDWRGAIDDLALALAERFPLAQREC